MSNFSDDTISRRRFLAIGSSAALAAACGGSGPGRPDGGSSSELDVAIVGAGISGLVAARTLVAAGVERVRVFEARDRVGGRTLNHRVGKDAIAEAGGQWIGPTQTEILALVDELGLSTFRTYDTGDTVVYFGGFRFTGRGDFLEPAERADLEQAVATLEDMASTVPVDAPWDAARAAEWDAMSFARWLDDAVSTGGARLELEGAISSTLATAAADVSLLYVLFYVASAGGYRALEDIDGGAQEQRVAGGAQLISLRLAEALGDRVSLASPVASMRDDGERVHLTLGGGDAYAARRVIVAMMPADTRRIAFDPPLPAQRRALVDGWRAGPGFKAHLVYERPFWRDQGLSGQAFTDGIVEAVFDNSQPSGTPGVLLVFANAAALPADAGARRDALASALVPVFGDEARATIGYADHDWTADGSVAGCVSPLPPGLLTAAGPALRPPVGRIHWAGTETSPVWTGYMEGAVRAGNRAAAEVLAAVPSRR